MIGQIASFMDSLHLTYDEVLDKIPYRNLCVMMVDKLHSAEKENLRREVSESEFFKMKNIKLK